MPHSLVTCARLLVAIVLIAGAGAGVARAAPAPGCAVPHELIEDDPTLPKLGARLRSHQPITIVAIGGASTAGRAAGNDEANAYPHWLEAALRRRHPGAPITVINRGVAGETTAAMVERFAADVFAARPTLVIWETGTVDAVHGNDIENFTAALEAGLAALHRQRIEAMLVDMQYNPGTASVIDFAPYLGAMHRTADLDDTYLFRRFDIMKYWSDTGAFDFVDVPKGKRAALAREVYKCLGESLADAIDFATR